MDTGLMPTEGSQMESQDGRANTQATPQEQPSWTFAGILDRLMAGARATKLEWGNRKDVVYFDGDLLTIQRQANNYEPKRWIVSRGDVLGTDWIVV